MRWLLLNSLLLWNLLLIAQTPSWQQVSLNITEEVLAMEFDSLGFMWLHDGRTFYRYDGQQLLPQVSLKDETITALFAHKNFMVLGTSYGRLLSFNPYNNQLLVLYESDDYKAITGLHYVDADNYALLSYGNGVRIVIDGNSLNFDSSLGLSSNEVYDIAFLNERYYIGTDQGIQIFDSRKSQPLSKNLSTSDGLVDIVSTHVAAVNGEIWYTDYDQHIGQVDATNHIENFVLPVKAKINHLSNYHHRLFVATDDGLYEHEKGSTNLIFNSESKVRISTVDHEGNLWVYTSTQELFKGSMYFQTIATDVDNMRAICMFEDELVFGNETGLYRLTNSSSTAISEDNITHLAQFDNYLLVGTFSEGIRVYDSRLKLISSVGNWSEINNQSVLYIYADSKSVYVSSLSGVMQFTMQNGRLLPVKSLNSVIGMGYIYTMIDHGEKMYFGTDRKGLITWDKTRDEIEQIVEFESGAKIGSVYALTLDTNDQLWFTSSLEGLGTLKSGTPRMIGNLPNSVDEYTSLTSLKNGDLLAIRSAAIDLLDIEKNNFMSYDKEIGLTDEIAFLNAVSQDGDRSYFVHDHTIYSYEPDSTFNIYPNVHLEKVLVNLAEVGSKSSFSQDENNVEFTFVGSWLTDPSKLIYQYRLLGFDTEWRTTKDRSVAYPKLDPGSYQFEVRASKNSYFSSEPAAMFEFEIQKYFYNTWWAKLSALVILGLIGWTLVRAREKSKKEKVELEKLNIENQLINLKNQLNPHFLFNAFNTLVGLIEEDQDRSVVFVERMTDFYRNMLEHGKKDLISLSMEKIILDQYIDILKARFNGQLDVSISLSETDEDYQIPPMTLQLLVENAVKHNVVSSKKPLRIDIVQNGSQLIVSNVKEQLLTKNPGAKVGLSNIKTRFQLVNLPAPQINDGDKIFEIILQLK